MKLYLSTNIGLAIALVGALGVAPAFGQRSSYVNQATQGYGFGAGAGGRLPFGSSGGPGGMGTNGYGYGAGNGTSFGNNAFGGSGFGGNSPFGNSSMSGSTFGQGRTGNNSNGLGSNGNGGQQFQQGGFIGRDANDVRAGFDATQRAPGQGGSLDQVIENLNEMRESRRRWREQRNAPPPIRVKLVPGFEPPSPSAGRAAPVVETRINRTLAAHSMAGAKIQIAGSVATLRGSVSTPHEAALAAQLAMLEPGVSQVQNLLTVTPPAAQ